MTYSTIFTEKEHYLLCVTDGAIVDVDMFVDWAKEVIAKAGEMDKTRLLIDNRTLELDLSSLDVVIFAKTLSEMGAASLGLRLAVVSAPRNRNIGRLVETALTNRSAAYKRFDNKDEALAWLGL